MTSPQPSSPVGWARLGRVSRWLARLAPTQPPPILVLSLGRSGSTWVASTLGEAAEALFLHEPLTQSLLAGGPHETNFDVDPRRPPANYQRWADDAFSGLPCFPVPPHLPTLIVRNPAQWAYGQRGRRRLVIKEINPFAAPWLLERYRPHLIYLVRHPAAVAVSNERLSFLKGDERWRDQGEHQGRAHRLVLDAIEKLQVPHRIVSYEALCEQPVEQFRELFTFAGLTWEDRLVEFIRQHSTGGDRSKPYDIARDSRAMLSAWHAEIAPDDLAALRSAFARYDLPWYREAAEWLGSGAPQSGAA